MLYILFVGNIIGRCALEIRWIMLHNDLIVNDRILCAQMDWINCVIWPSLISSWIIFLVKIIKYFREYSFGENEEGDVIGKGAKLEDVHKDNVCTFLGCEPLDVTTYRRFRHRDGQLVACDKKTKNAAIAFLTKDGTKHGLIKTFPVYKSLTYALVEKLEEKERVFTFADITNPGLVKYRGIELLPHLRRVKRGGMTIIPVRAIQRKCVYMELGNKIFISQPPNLVEHD